MSETIKVGTKNNLDELLENPVVLIDVWAPWCGWCRAISPKIDRIAEELGEKATIIKIDMDEFPEIKERYEFQTIPALIFLKGGKIVKQSGTIPEEEIKATLEEMAG